MMILTGCLSSLISQMSDCISPESITIQEYEDYDGSYQRITKFRPAVTYQFSFLFTSSRYDQFIQCKDAVEAVRKNVIRKQSFDFHTLTNHIEDQMEESDDSQVAFEMINDDYNFTFDKV